MWNKKKNGHKTNQPNYFSSFFVLRWNGLVLTFFLKKDGN